MEAGTKKKNAPAMISSALLTRNRNSRNLIRLSVFENDIITLLFKKEKYNDEDGFAY